jgi:hypothetical protein
MKASVAVNARTETTGVGTSVPGALPGAIDLSGAMRGVPRATARSHERKDVLHGTVRKSDARLAGARRRAARGRLCLIRSRQPTRACASSSCLNPMRSQ